MTQQVHHLLGGNLLGVEEVVDTNVDKDLLVVGFEIFVVVDAGDGLACAELFGNHCRDDVGALFAVYGDKEVGLAHRGLFECCEGGAVALDGHHVGGVREVFEQLGVAVDNTDVVVALAQHSGQVATHFSCSCNYDSHTVSSLSV